MSSTTNSNTKPNFGHIYYADWQIGANYERKVSSGIMYLGRLVSKRLTGRTYDPDIILIFESPNGTQYEHMIDFDHSYRAC